ncbi:MAG: hypothetical protein AB7N24_00330 [Dehalococcoidia bacterium]
MKALLAVMVAAALLSACGGGGAARPPTPGPTPTRAAVSDVDVSYMRIVCRAFGRYTTDFGNEIQKDPNLFSDQSKLLRIAAPILETFAKDLDKAKPPKDMANFHKSVVDRVKTTASKAKGGLVITPEEVQNITKGSPLPPVTVRERLDEAADALPECGPFGGTDALFGDTGG